MTMDPASANLLGMVLREHILPKTSSSYMTGINSFLNFCRERGVSPWPVDPIWFAAWMLKLGRSIAHTSLKMYMAGVRHGQELEGFDWELSDNATVRSVLRWMRRRYPTRKMANKIAISTSVLKQILPHLPGWPNLAVMRHDDAVFATASVLATSAFLRGGEFLFEKGSDRPLLRRSNMDIRPVAGSTAVVIHVVQPKTSWWLDEVLIPCFANSAMVDFCPVALWRNYLALFASPLLPSSPAFVMQSGAPLSKVFMLSRTAELLATAGIRCLDGSGEVVRLVASSWRAGGVRSALDAGVPESRIMALGRWKTSAWMHYLIHSPLDFQGAAAKMWAVQAPLELRSGCLRVGGCDTGASFVSEINHQDRVMLDVMARTDR
jgi:hypothetical protein